MTNENLPATGNQNPSSTPAAAPTAHQGWARQGVHEGAPASPTNPWVQGAPDPGWNSGQNPSGAVPTGPYWSGAAAPDSSATDSSGGTAWFTRRFGVGVLAAAAAVALVAGGVGGYAIGHTVAVSQISTQLGGTSDTMTPGTGNQQMGPGGGPGQQGNNQEDGNTQDGTGSGGGTGAQGETQDGTSTGTGFGTGASFWPTGESAPIVDA